MTSSAVHQNKVLHAILGTMKVNKENKKVLVEQYTKGRSSSSADMTYEERQALINWLNSEKQRSAQVVPVPKPVYDRNDPENKMRRKVISLCHDLGMQLPGGKIDMSRVNALCIDRGHKHKPLNKYTKAELPTLITQVEKMVKDYLKNK